MNGLDTNFLDDLEMPDADTLSDAPPEATPALQQILQILPEVTEEHELYSLKCIIEGQLPPIDLSTLDLEAELAMQLRDARVLMATTMSNKYIPANQKAQTVSTVTRALDAIASTQIKVYNAERVKIMEQALMVTLREHPDAEALIDTFESTFDRMLKAKKS